MAASAWLHGPASLRLTEALVSALREQRSEFVPALLWSYREHAALAAQGSSTAGGLVGFSNSKLASSKTKFEGLCLLSLLVKDGSTDMFQQHCLSWLRSLQQVVQSQAPVQTVQLAVSVLKDVLQYSAQLPEVAREVGLNSVLGILTSLLGLKAECELAAMEGMMACMTFYPRACGSLRDKLGAYFLSKMDGPNKKAQEVAAQCYARLPCLGRLMERGVGAGRADGWTNQIHCLLASANQLLAQLYQGAESEGTVQYEGPGVELAFSPLDQSDPLLLLQLQHRYAAVCLALRHTLRVDPASAVRLPVRPVLNMVCRALAVSTKNINLSGEGGLRLLVLPVIHTHTLEVLSALITAVRAGLVQFCSVLHSLFSQTLSAWASPPDCSLGQQRAYSSVRVSVYRCLELWVRVGGASAGVLHGAASHSELLFAHLLGDITPGPECVKLRAGLSADVVPGGKPGPRRTKTLVMADAVGPSLQRKGDPLANQDTCLWALRVLRRIILSSGTLLKDVIHKRLHEVVLPLCVRLQQQSSSAPCDSAAGASGQYSSAATRRELYRLLLALVLAPPPRWPPPLTCAVSILSSGRNDYNLKVSSFCSEALSVCNALLHPRTPSISLPLPPLTLKAPPTAPVLPPQGPAPGLALPTLLGGPASGSSSFPARHSLGLGPSSLLGSLENHLSLVPGLSQSPASSAAATEMLHPPHPPEPVGLGTPDGQRPVFVRYDKEEADDVEISLGSDSDDSVVIVPPGMLSANSQQDDAAAANAGPSAPAAPNSSSGTPGGAGVPLPSGESGASLVPPSTSSGAADGVLLPNELPASSSLMAAAASSGAPINSFPPPTTALVSMVPALSSGGVPPAEALPGRPQLQQMLMQQGAGPVTGPMALPLQMHQLQNQLSQQGRHLHPPPQAPPINEDSAVININSTDEEEEDMEDDEELDEEEEGLDEEEEEEEGSDYPDEEFYDGEEYEEYDEEEGEELDEEEEEEEDEDGDIPPLEGSEEKREGEEAKQEGGLSSFSLEGEVEGGIEEIQAGRAAFPDDRMKVQEVESIGVLEEAQGGRAEEDEEEDENGERMGDPTMPQILCVTGGSLEEREEEEEEEEEEPRQEARPWEPAGPEAELSTSEEEHQQRGAESSQAQLQLDEEAPQPASQQQEQPAAPAAPAEEGQSVGSAEDTPPTQAEDKSEELEGEIVAEEVPESRRGGMEGESEEEDGRGVKRKREEAEQEAEGAPSGEKKTLDEEAMASMLADFVACPPDDEDGAAASHH